MNYITGSFAFPKLKNDLYLFHFICQNSCDDLINNNHIECFWRSCISSFFFKVWKDLRVLYESTLAVPDFAVDQKGESMNLHLDVIP